MRKKYLISFASPDLKRSVHRFYEQTNNLNFYDHVKVFSIFDLDDKYQRYISNYLANRRNKKTGYGYWFWKPLIINNFLKKLKEDDILNYSDIGCHYNVNGTERLNYYVQKALDSDKGILAFQATQPRTRQTQQSHMKNNQYVLLFFVGLVILLIFYMISIVFDNFL